MLCELFFSWFANYIASIDMILFVTYYVLKHLEKKEAQVPESKKYGNLSSESLSSADYRLVEKNLTKLWKSMAEGHEAKTAITRVSVLNLVVFVQEESAREKVDVLVDAITGHPPLRVIFIQVDRKVQQDYLDAFVSVSCRLPTEGEKQLCCEKITLSAGGKGVDQISHGLLPLLEPDLPVFLFWQGGLPVDNKNFQRLVGVCNRVVIDSADFHASSKVFVPLSRWVEKNGSEATISDLNWARLTPWREWVAEFFDPLPNRRYLPAINRVIFEISGKKEEAIAPYLLLGWLSSLLNWKLVDKKEDRFAFQKTQEGSLVEAEMKTIPSREQKSVLSGLMLSSESPAMKLHISFVQERACVSWMSASEERGNKCQEISLKVPDEPRLFSEELQILKRDRIYEASLAQAASFCRD